MPHTTATRTALHHHRSLFMSDLHLGSLGCRADLILGFLREHQADTYFLVGDILDLWHPLVPHWTADHQAIVDHFAARQAAGARVVYLTGNHDPEPQSAPAPVQIAASPVRDVLHTTAAGRTLLVMHGDQCDNRVLRGHTLTRIGSRIDFVLRWMDRRLTSLRRRARGEQRTLIEWSLSRINILMYLGRAHERRLIAVAKGRGVDGVVCGHFHMAELHNDHGLTYANCGDWVDSFTALAEDPDGALRLVGGRKALGAPSLPAPATGLGGTLVGT